MNNLHKPAEMYYFIGKCLVMDEKTERADEVQRMITSGEIQWEDLVWISSLSMVTPALYSAFHRQGFLPLLPGDLVEHLEYIYKLNAERNYRLTTQALEINKILAGKGIETVFLKGTGHLLQGLYHDHADRVIGDIDLLVREEDLDRAAGLLNTVGYVISDSEPVESYTEHHHYPGMYRVGEPAMLEMHREPLYPKFAAYLTAGEVFRDKFRCSQTGVFVPSVRHQLVINYVHSQLTDGGMYYGQPSMKYLYDYYMLSRLVPGEPAAKLPGNNGRYNVFRNFVSTVFDNPDCPVHQPGYRSGWFLFRHRVLLSSNILRKINRFVLMNLDRTGIYSGLLLRWFFSSKARKELRNRLNRNVLGRNRRVQV